MRLCHTQETVLCWPRDAAQKHDNTRLRPRCASWQLARWVRGTAATPSVESWLALNCAVFARFGLFSHRAPQHAAQHKAYSLATRAVRTTMKVLDSRDYSQSAVRGRFGESDVNGTWPVQVLSCTLRVLATSGGLLRWSRSAASLHGLRLLLRPCNTTPESFYFLSQILHESSFNMCSEWTSAQHEFFLHILNDDKWNSWLIQQVKTTRDDSWPENEWSCS